MITAQENTPYLYRHTPSKWPMIHPDTGKPVILPADKSIKREPSRREAETNSHWWEPIQMQREYTELLTRTEWDWTWYGHLTFKEPVHPEAADKVWMKWVHIINRQVFGVRYWNRKETDGVVWCRGLEMQKRNVIHFHFLMSRVPGETRRLWAMDEWHKMAGYARVHPYIRAGGAEQYICKYAAKGGELDFGGPVHLVVGREQEQGSLFKQTGIE
jgi:hypothetical protein